MRLQYLEDPPQVRPRAEKGRTAGRTGTERGSVTAHGPPGPSPRVDAGGDGVGGPAKDDEDGASDAGRGIVRVDESTPSDGPGVAWERTLWAPRSPGNDETGPHASRTRDL